MSAASDAIDILTKQYYNAVAAGTGLAAAQFQLAQGSISLGTTSTKIWQMFDSLPPAALNTYFNPSLWNSFGSTYGAVINNLFPQDAGAMAELLSDSYIDWTNYKTPPNPIPYQPAPNDYLIDTSKYKKIQFQNWCLQSGQSQETIIAGIGLLSQVDFISAAAVKWQAASVASVFAYTATAQRLKEAIERGQAKTVALDSKTQSSDTSNSWASGEVSGGYGFFGARASASWDKFSQDIQQKGVQLNVQFQKLATLTGSPLSSPNTLDIDLSKYLPWYDSKVIQTAYTENNNNVWKRTPPTWESTFGPNGNLKNLTVALVIVDGITSTMTTTASVSQDNRESFQTAAKAGYWPFFSAEGQGGWSTDVKFNDDGSVTVTSSSKAGNPNVLGVLVSPFTNAFNG
ncbi:hypothetical protein LC653_26390 [Nostoc sp. CHAB 5784]|uniref:hypothetical protein n=1 Tax=Nostoc mirabile TaxID=2907820 RepID=UPI001E33B049|nr:hypothetical protein [Nostoc mirabile]MCC5667315.1 hypothetical protein [Nostoc mirabile CHAB5784]